MLACRHTPSKNTNGRNHRPAGSKTRDKFFHDVSRGGPKDLHHLRPRTANGSVFKNSSPESFRLQEHPILVSGSGSTKDHSPEFCIRYTFKKWHLFHTPPSTRNGVSFNIENYVTSTTSDQQDVFSAYADCGIKLPSTVSIGILFTQ